ncbi:Endoribonuclease L-PSP [Hyphomicrobiales bacterium]|nr:Endoribonuclease L-PSP [Hyphomicrobiales bacterium]CAH1691413.1 Endoribonuclease L-PSP [Hyphomicrobiales bacterium]
MTHYDPEGRLEELGLVLPPTRKPVGTYVGACQEGNLVLVAGHGPFDGPQQLYKGRLGREIDIKTGYLASKATILSSLASLKAQIGNLNRVERIMRVYGMVNCTPEFERQPEVIDGASDLLVQIFGEKGQHTRCAVGFCSLPFGMPVEIEMTVAVR